MKGFDELARTHPSIPIIAAHLGSYLPEVIEAARKYPNVFLDMAGYPVTGENLKKILKILPADKIIFGSDSPGGIGGSIKSQREALDRSGATPRQKEQILYRNIIRLVPRVGQMLMNQEVKLI